jgi:hypothetical protein
MDHRQAIRSQLFFTSKSRPLNALPLFHISTNQKPTGLITSLTMLANGVVSLLFFPFFFVLDYYSSINALCLFIIFSGVPVRGEPMEAKGVN